MSKLSDFLFKELESLNTDLSPEKLEEKLKINKAINETAKNLNQTISLEIQFQKFKAENIGIVEKPKSLN